MVHRLSLHLCKFCIKLQLPSEEPPDQLQNPNQQRHHSLSQQSGQSSGTQVHNLFRHILRVKKVRIDLTYLAQRQLDCMFAAVYDEVNPY